MCKYCDGNNNFVDVGIRTDTGKHRVYLCGGNNHPPDDERFDFCPKCGTPLGEVKPLTVEQLKKCEGKPVWIEYFTSPPDIVHWVIFWLIDFEDEMEEYGEIWNAYVYPPKE